jgi:hypothetical protein
MQGQGQQGSRAAGRALGRGLGVVGAGVVGWTLDVRETCGKARQREVAPLLRTDTSKTRRERQTGGSLAGWQGASRGSSSGSGSGGSIKNRVVGCWLHARSMARLEQRPRRLITGTGPARRARGNPFPLPLPLPTSTSTPTPTPASTYTSRPLQPPDARHVARRIVSAQPTRPYHAPSALDVTTACQASSQTASARRQAANIRQPTRTHLRNQAPQLR